MPHIWIIVPSYNEAANLEIVVPQIASTVKSLPGEFRIVVVDDGSTDETAQVIERLSAEHPLVSTMRSRRNEGKATALRRGFKAAIEAGASHVLMMDADGQDSPHEIPRLLAKLDEGYSLVTGARGRRQDRFIKRTSSRFYNFVTGLFTGAPGSDFNSGFKAMTSDVARELVPLLYGELHRYITVIAHWRGFRIAEVEVEHHPRLHGKTKYGLARFWRGSIDLLTIRFLMSYEQRPSHLFGAIGVVTSIAGAGILLYLLIERLSGQSIGERPLLIAGVLLFLTGLQVVVFGLLAELIVYGRQRRSAWSDDN